MWGQRLCLNILEKTEIKPEELIRKYKEAGFDGFFVSWSGVNSLNRLAKIAEDEGMMFQSIHAPFSRMANMWKSDSEKGDEALEELLLCLEDCRKLKVPIMVVHTYIGFEEKNPNPPQIGLMRFEKLVLEAEKANVKIAFENTEGEEYLDALMQYFAHSPNVGFCWDTGHEMCYNHSRDLLADYGDRLIATHINDNLGISDFDGKTTFIDDFPYGKPSSCRMTPRFLRCNPARLFHPHPRRKRQPAQTRYQPAICLYQFSLKYQGLHQ